MFLVNNRFLVCKRSDGGYSVQDMDTLPNINIDIENNEHLVEDGRQLDCAKVFDIIGYIMKTKPPDSVILDPIKTADMLSNLDSIVHKEISSDE